MVKYVIGLVESNDIEKERFDALLAQYPSVIRELSERKGAKDGQQTLEELDRYRYGEALVTFGGDEPERRMELDDVKKLVEWKLRHGKFRPSLMKLVSSNDPNFVKDTIQEALQAYRPASDAQAALNILTKLKGIGPATASLLLTVHDPENVIFFSDEAYWWVCCGIHSPPIKYTAKEYQALQAGAKEFCERVGVSATDLEKVSYVLKRPMGDPMSWDRVKAEIRAAKPAASTSTQKTKAAAPSVKRKAEAKAETAEGSTSQDPPLRRSKRTRAKA